MKLDKIRFAMVISWVSRRTAGIVDDQDCRELDDIITFEQAPQSMTVTDLHTLMALMQEGTRKIDAIKQHRMMTGYGLKESKDIVEKYWPKSDGVLRRSKQELYDKLNEANLPQDIDNAISTFISKAF
jgi:ribosomal protein L7/L12